MKKFLIIFVFILISAYATMWVASANIYSNFSKSLSNSDKQIATIDGFPFLPRLTFSGEYHLNDGSTIFTPGLQVRGFPFPAQSLTISAPQGLQFRAAYWVSDVAIDDLTIKFQIPLRIPRTNLKSDWLAWQSSGDGIEMKSLTGKIKDFTLSGSDGLLQLDKNLEWQGAMTTRLVGTDQFLMTLSEEGMIPPKAALTAQNFLQFLTRTDEVTGERFILTSVQMRKNIIYIGPVRVTAIPPLQLQ